MNKQEKNTNKRKVLRGLGTFLTIILSVVLVFSLGNLSSSLWGVSFAHMVGLKNTLAKGSDDPESKASSRQLAARIDEAAFYLDVQSIYPYTQEDINAATSASINALIEQSDDEHALYLNSEELAEYERDSKGEYLGIGVVLTTRDEKPTVLQIYEDAPAFKAGVLPGDQVVAINSERRAFSVEEVAELIHASKTITITWLRGEEEFDTYLVPSSVNIPNVVSHLIEANDTKVGYLHLRRFSENSADELREAISALESSGAQALVLDMRGNPGGYLTEAIAVTSLFVKEGNVVQIDSSSTTRVEKVSGKTCTDKPLAVLIDATSASASELTAAALKDHGRATIVGETSHGKGTVQDLKVLSWGGALKFTIAHYKSPNGTVIDGQGVTPNTIVTYDIRAVDMTLNDYVTSSNFIYSAGKDLQLDAALVEAGLLASSGS